MIKSNVFRIGTAIVCLAGAASVSQAQTSTDLSKLIGITQKLGAQVPVAVPFKDETGQTVTLGTYLTGKPILLMPVYYTCQAMCAISISNLEAMLAKASTTKRIMVGRDFNVVLFSIDPRDTPKVAMAKKQMIMNDLNMPYTADHWHLLTGTYANIRKVTDAIGYKYDYDASDGLIQHPTCSLILQPSGRISTYIIGPNFDTVPFEADIRLAAKSQVGVVHDQTFLFGCLCLDPVTHKLSIRVDGILNVLCVLTVVGLATMVVTLSVKRRVKHALPPGGDGA